MGATKTDHFTERQNKLAILTKAMAHPARIAIIDYLLKVDACICGEIVNELLYYASVPKIYLQGIATGVATFQTESPT